MKRFSLKRIKIKILPRLLIINIAIVAAIALLCVKYVHRVSEDMRQVMLDNFSTTVATMEQSAHGYMKNQQRACDGWALYINENQLGMAEALSYLSLVNSDAYVMAHLVDADTLIGYSDTPDSAGNIRMDYTRISDLGFTEEEADADDDDIHISNMFTNPINGMNAVAFANRVRIAEADGTFRQYVLLRVVSIREMLESWVFPLEFEKAELSLIKPDGNYIIRSSALKSANFWEHLRIYSHLDYQESYALKERMLAGSPPYLGSDADGNAAYYVCCASGGDGEWCFIGFLPAESVNANGINWGLLVYVLLGCVVIFLVNGMHVLSINRSLKQSVEETRKANMAKTQFLSSMSHDIRTPMNAIIGMTTIATKHIDDKNQVMDCLNKITLASNHLLTLVNDVLDISKVESGKMNLAPTLFSLNDLVTNLANIVRPQIKAKALEFVIHTLNISCEHLFADELRLNQIFINILSNAVKYTPPGGKVVMTVEEKPVAGDQKTVELRYTVSDTGIGISKEFQKVMYDTFSRAVDTRIDKIQGSGLGLAITKQMVDLMGGTIECDSEEGKGTTFVITLRVPIADKAEEDMTLPPMEALIVDDDEIFLETARDMLESLNMKVDVANSGREAIRMVAEKHKAGKDYPVIIVDWRMPEMNGGETAKRIRAEIGAEVPIIVISAYDWTDIEESARAAGADFFINKPLFKSTVYYKMREILQLDEGQKDENEPDYGEFKGLHLLVAEDNDLNWEIIDELLSLYDISAERAENGEICVDMLLRAEKGHYDAILMDIQMPVMNGKDACRAIRALKEDVRSGIPIIAMTADAFSEDIRACLDAGMNGHVAKPVDLKKLFAELSKAGLNNK